MPNRRQMPSRFHPSPGVVGLVGECAREEIESGGERKTHNSNLSFNISHGLVCAKAMSSSPSLWGGTRVWQRQYIQYRGPAGVIS